MKRAADYASLAEVRAEIDRLDRLLIPLIAERGQAVLAAARFKSFADVPAPDRVEQVVAHVKRLAREHGADEQVVETTWRCMIAAFIEAERIEHIRLHGPPHPER
jgi:isochorismate pyruvate lyase